MSLPAVPDTFEWIEAPWGAALRCPPLEEIAPHLFTTRQLALSTHDDWDLLARAVGARQVQTLVQVHGRDVAVVRKPSGSRPEADVLVSDNPEVAIAVRAADCVPILIADPRTGAVAAVHAGWRGTAAGVASAAVTALERELGAKPGDLVAAIGPSIGPCCYEVGTEVVDAFAAAGHARHLVDRWFTAPSDFARGVPSAVEGTPPPRRGESERPRLRLDTWIANRDQLILAGLDEQNIHTCGLCTASHVDLFPSYRVEKDRAGRLAGVIRSNQPRNARNTRNYTRSSLVFGGVGHAVPGGIG